MPAIKIRKLETYTGTHAFQSVIVSLRLLCTEKDLDDIARLFTVAFEGDLVALAMLGGDGSLIYALERATVACVAKSGELWVASYRDKDFVSAATWLRPAGT